MELTRTPSNTAARPMAHARTTDREGERDRRDLQPHDCPHRPLRPQAGRCASEAAKIATLRSTCGPCSSPWSACVARDHLSTTHAIGAPQPRLVPGFRPHQPVPDRPRPRHPGHRRVRGAGGHRGVRQRHHPLVAVRHPAAALFLAGKACRGRPSPWSWRACSPSPASARPGHPVRRWSPVGPPGPARGARAVIMLSAPSWPSSGCSGSASASSSATRPGPSPTFVGLHLPPAAPAAHDPRQPGPLHAGAILANSVSAVVHQPASFRATVGFLLMVVYTAAVLVAGRRRSCPARRMMRGNRPRDDARPAPGAGQERIVTVSEAQASRSVPSLAPSCREPFTERTWSELGFFLLSAGWPVSACLHRRHHGRSAWSWPSRSSAWS